MTSKSSPGTIATISGANKKLKNYTKSSQIALKPCKIRKIAKRQSFSSATRTRRSDGVSFSNLVKFGLSNFEFFQRGNHT